MRLKTVGAVATRSGATKRRSMPTVSILALMAGLLVLAGCGSSSSTTSSSASTPTSAATPTTESSSASTSTAASAAATSGGSNLSLEANHEGQLKYNTTSLTAKTGKVSIDFTNMAPVEHNVTIESSAHAIVGHTPTSMEAQRRWSLNLEPRYL